MNIYQLTANLQATGFLHARTKTLSSQLATRGWRSSLFWTDDEDHVVVSLLCGVSVYDYDKEVKAKLANRTSRSARRLGLENVGYCAL